MSRQRMTWPEWYRGLLMAGLGDLEADPGSPAERLERARQFIDGHFDEPLDLDAMARQAYLSRYHFLRQFRRAFGETPHQYLTRRRISRARELLEATDRSVTDVCLDVGFSSLGSFSALFHRYVGHPPSRYRRGVLGIGWEPPAVAIPWCFASAYRSPE